MRVLAAALVLTLAVAPGVAAQDRNSGAPSIENDEKGKLHFEAGKHLFALGYHARALEEFTAGYRLTSRPAFLLNMAQCHRHLGDLSRARDTLQEFISLQPESPMVAKVRKIVDEIDAEIASTAGRAAPALPANPLPTGPLPTPAVPTAPPPAATSEAAPSSSDPRAAGRTRSASARADLTAAPDAAPSAPATPTYKKWWPWTLAGVVAVGLGVGLGVGLTRGGASRDFRATQPTFEVVGPGQVR